MCRNRPSYRVGSPSAQGVEEGGWAGEQPDEPASRPGGKADDLPPARERHGHELAKDAEREGRPAVQRGPEGEAEAARLAARWPSAGLRPGSIVVHGTPP